MELDFFNYTHSWKLGKRFFCYHIHDVIKGIQCKKIMGYLYLFCKISIGIFWKHMKL